MKKYEMLHSQLQKEIVNRLQNGESRLPTEHALCQIYGVSRQTVRKSLAQLIAEGLIHKRQGSGIYLTGMLPGKGQNDIAVMLASPEEYIFPELLSSMNSQLSSRGFRLQQLENDGDFMKERDILQALLESPPRALLSEGFSSLPNPNADLYTALSAAGTALLFLFAKSPNLPAYPTVHEDNAGGAAMLVKMLYEHGHRRIRGIFRTDKQQGMERCFGFLSALRDYGLSFGKDEILLLNGGSRNSLLSAGSYLNQSAKKAGGRQSIQPADQQPVLQFFESFFSGCTAVVCYNDGLAYDLLQIARLLSVRVPEDLSLVSFDASFLRKSESLVISSLTHNTQSVPAAAAERISAMLLHQTVPDEDLLWQLMPGNSVKWLQA